MHLAQTDYGGIAIRETSHVIYTNNRIKRKKSKKLSSILGNLNTGTHHWAIGRSTFSLRYDCTQKDRPAHTGRHMLACWNNNNNKKKTNDEDDGVFFFGTPSNMAMNGVVDGGTTSPLGLMAPNDSAWSRRKPTFAGLSIASFLCPLIHSS
ncbi:hypothetical protein BLOT_003267 [Blomia tropicalis]|nr:hypothetical protein BLOT_003267 [Blomia tropicalis]